MKTKYYVWVADSLLSYSWHPRLKPWPESVFLSPSWQMPVSCHRLSHNHFLRNSYSFLINWSPYHLTLYSLQPTASKNKLWMHKWLCTNSVSALCCQHLTWQAAQWIHFCSFLKCVVSQITQFCHLFLHIVI